MKETRSPGCKRRPSRNFLASVVVLAVTFWEGLPVNDTLVRLYFGRDDAEHDLTDGLLREGFLSTEAYEEALSGRKTLVIGRKGSGKSAICMRLSMGGVRRGATILVTPDDAAGSEIRRFELQGLTNETAKSIVWRYVFAVQIARYITAMQRPNTVAACRAQYGRCGASSRITVSSREAIGCVIGLLPAFAVCSQPCHWRLSVSRRQLTSRPHPRAPVHRGRWRYWRQVSRRPSRT